MVSIRGAAATAPRVIAVVDTRSFVEVGNRWVPVPGSGLPHDCARCGREHEVHVEVAYADGRHAVVGTSCADLAPEDARRVARSATTVARLRAQLERARELFERARAADAAAAAMTPPPLEREDGKLRCGDIGVRVPSWHTDPGERERCAVDQWRARRYAELVGPDARPPYIYRERVEDLDRRLARAERPRG